jgi:hypothetical protein
VPSDPTFSLYRDGGNRFVQTPEAVGSCKVLIKWKCVGCTVGIRLLCVATFSSNFKNELYRTSSIRVLLEQLMVVHMKTEGSIWYSHGNEYDHGCSEFEVLTAVVIFCGVAPYGSLKVNRRFGETCNFYLQGRRINQARNQHCLPPASRWFLAWLILRFCRRRQNVPPNRRLTFNGLHCFIAQKLELFMKITVFCGMTPCSLVDICLRFEETCCLCL